MEYYDVLEREARRSFQPQIDKLQEVIDLNNKLIDTKQREIEIKYDRPIAALEAQSTILNHDLSLMDKSAQGINDKYDAQEKALSAIQQVNQQIIDQENGRLDIANALSVGDISAAAIAIQQVRATNAAAAQQRATDSISSARQFEIDNLKNAQGLTRKQIEEQIYQIGEKTYALEQAKIPLMQQIQALQDANYNIQVNQLLPLQEGLNQRLQSLDLERQKYTDIQLAIDSAKVKSIEYQDELKNAQVKAKGILDTIKKLDTTVTTTHIIKTIRIDSGGKGDTGSGSSVGGGVGAFDKNMYGGKIMPMASGGMVPKYMAVGGRVGSDTVPALLTPGEFVMNKKATQEFGPLLSMLNESKYPSMIGSGLSGQVPINSVSTSVSDNSTAVYNYSLGFNINGSSANPNEIARAVMTQIKQVDGQRIRRQRA
jgi:hypothetical protein